MAGLPRSRASIWAAGLGVVSSVGSRPRPRHPAGELSSPAFPPWLWPYRRGAGRGRGGDQGDDPEGPDRLNDSSSSTRDSFPQKHRFWSL